MKKLILALTVVWGGLIAFSAESSISFGVGVPIYKTNIQSPIAKIETTGAGAGFLMSGRLGSKYVFAFDIGVGGSRLKDSRIADGEKFSFSETFAGTNFVNLTDVFFNFYADIGVGYNIIDTSVFKLTLSALVGFNLRRKTYYQFASLPVKKFILFEVGEDIQGTFKISDGFGITLGCKVMYQTGKQKESVGFNNYSSLKIQDISITPSAGVSLIF